LFGRSRAEQNLAIVERLAAFCAERGRTMLAILHELTGGLWTPLYWLGGEL
jgi:hypothetical protein